MSRNTTWYANIMLLVVLVMAISQLVGIYGFALPFVWPLQVGK